MPTLTLHNQDRAFELEAGQNLFTFLRRNRLPIQSACGGMGTCGKCRVRYIEAPPAPTPSEEALLTQDELSQGIRLSCLHTVETAITLALFEVNSTADAKEQLKTDLNVEVAPGIVKVCLKLRPGARHDQRPDTVRVQDALGEKRLRWSRTALVALHGALRQGEGQLTLTRVGNRVLDVTPGDASGQLYGVAFDLGTTTLAGYLFDLATGEELVVKSLMNPQRHYGSDVIARIKHVRDRGEKALNELHQVMRSGVNALLKMLCREARIESHHLYKAVFAGNPTMIHFLLGLDPSGIDHSPYLPVTRDLGQFRGSDLGLDMHPEGLVFVLPNLSGYVGGDVMAGVLATGLHRAAGINLLVDIGTNAEIVLGNQERLIACSSPAGPAFEGAEIRCGMSATPGAISHVSVHEGELTLDVIGDCPPQGICGSGLVDVVGQLLKVRLISPRGNLLVGEDHPLGQRISVGEDGQPRFQLTEGDNDLSLSQKDIRELQLAKGAIRSGVDIVLQEFGLEVGDLDHIYLAGAFGNFLRVENVLRIGLLPQVSEAKIVPVGNAAGTGAKLCLLNAGKLEEIQALTERMEYFELSNYEKFSAVFMGSMLFPDTQYSGKGSLTDKSHIDPQA